MYKLVFLESHPVNCDKTGEKCKPDASCNGCIYVKKIVHDISSLLVGVYSVKINDSFPIVKPPVVELDTDYVAYADALSVLRGTLNTFGLGSSLTKLSMIDEYIDKLRSQVSKLREDYGREHWLLQYTTDSFTKLDNRNKCLCIDLTAEQKAHQATKAELDELRKVVEQMQKDALNNPLVTPQIYYIYTSGG